VTSFSSRLATILQATASRRFRQVQSLTTKPGFWVVSLSPLNPSILFFVLPSSEPRVADTFLKNVYFTTNVQTSNVELSARTDTPGVSVSSGGIAASSTTSSGTAAASAAESNRADMKSSSVRRWEGGKTMGVISAGVIAWLVGRS
jgi:hypothetical protein